MIGPCGGGEVDCLLVPEAFEKVTTDTEGASARERLDSCNAVGLDCRTVLAKDEAGN